MEANCPRRHWARQPAPGNGGPPRSTAGRSPSRARAPRGPFARAERTPPAVAMHRDPRTERSRAPGPGNLVDAGGPDRGGNHRHPGARIHAARRCWILADQAGLASRCSGRMCQRAPGFQIDGIISCGLRAEISSRPPGNLRFGKRSSTPFHCSRIGRDMQRIIAKRRDFRGRRTRWLRGKNRGPDLPVKEGRFRRDVPACIKECIDVRHEIIMVTRAGQTRPMSRVDTK